MRSLTYVLGPALDMAMLCASIKIDLLSLLGREGAYHQQVLGHPFFGHLWDSGVYTCGCHGLLADKEMSSGLQKPQCFCIKRNFGLCCNPHHLNIWTRHYLCVLSSATSLGKVLPPFQLKQCFNLCGKRALELSSSLCEVFWAAYLPHLRWS